MRSAQAILEQIADIAGVQLVDGRATLEIRYENRDQAQAALAQLRKMREQASLLRQEILGIEHDIRRVHSDAVAFQNQMAVDDLRAGIETPYAREIDADMKREIRVKQHAALTPYAEAKAIVNRFLLGLRGLEAKIRSSPENSAPPPRPRRANGMGVSYFVKIEGEAKGPLSAEQVRGLALAGVVSGETLVQPEGIDAWIPIDSVAALRGQ